MLSSEAEADAVGCKFRAGHAKGTLFAWHREGGFLNAFIWAWFMWVWAGIAEPATPVFPVTAWC